MKGFSIRKKVVSIRTKEISVWTIWRNFYSEKGFFIRIKVVFIRTKEISVWIIWRNFCWEKGFSIRTKVVSIRRKEISFMKKEIFIMRKVVSIKTKESSTCSCWCSCLEKLIRKGHQIELSWVSIKYKWISFILYPISIRYIT